ncbi:hypothetical protein MKZ38_003653 [Zalerion maritima]|uniref:Amidase domain-containing protein n=1 Tax=Zalerion maritima TaxID=339359 RepID=A0AAD5RNU7_9PEZI|nr:hypothetical protein MKZ38_003653 [Zalerion maritima]
MALPKNRHPIELETDPFDLLNETAGTLREKLEGGTLTSVQLAQACLDRIDEYDSWTKAVLAPAPRENVYAIAKELDAERTAGNVRSALHGIPILIKDNICTDPRLGMDTTAGAAALVGSKPQGNAPVVQQFIDAGAIVIGKANLSELSWFRSASAPAGWSTVGRQTQSPYVVGGFLLGWDSGCGHTNPGGSSSGPAVGVAAGFAPLSIGTETVGSLILPANRADLYTMKPTVGSVSVEGIVPISKFCDSAGPMAKCVSDMAAALDIMLSETSGAKGRPAGGYRTRATGKWEGLRIGSLNPDDWDFSEETRKKFEGVEEDMKESTLKAYATVKGVADSFHENIDLIDPEKFSPDGKSILGQIFDATFRHELNGYLSTLASSKVLTLEELIRYNEDHIGEYRDKYTDGEDPPPEEYTKQEFLDSAQKKKLPKSEIDGLVKLMRRLGRDEGVDKAFEKYDINIILGPAESPITTVAAAAGMFHFFLTPFLYPTLQPRVSFSEANQDDEDPSTELRLPYHLPTSRTALLAGQASTAWTSSCCGSQPGRAADTAGERVGEDFP